MEVSQFLYSSAALAPVVLMAVVATLALPDRVPAGRLWGIFQTFSCGALVLAGISVVAGANALQWSGAVKPTTLSLILALLVQLLGTVIGGFSARYLQGEAGQRRYVAALAAVLAAVHLLLMADHWLILIAALAFV